MEFNLEDIPFWTILTGHLIFFIILIFMALTTFNIIIVILFLAIEILTLFCARFPSKKYFYIGWEVEAFLFILIAIVFNFEHTFLVADPLPITIAVMAATVVAVEVVILSYLIFGERVIKWILLTLASSTSIIVFLIIIFVISEGGPAFIENDPVDLITGTYFNPNYDIDTEESAFIETTIVPNSFRVEFSRSNYLIPVGMMSTLNLAMENTGGLADEYQIRISSEDDIEIFNSTQEKCILPDFEANVAFDIYSDEVGTYLLQISVNSANTGEEKIIEKNVVVSDGGVVFNPDILYINEVDMDVATTYDLLIENVGSNPEWVNLSIESPSALRPSLGGEGVEWNYTTNSALLMLEGNEKRNITFTPRLISLIEGEYLINITGESIPSQERTTLAQIHFTYRKSDYLTVTETSKSVVTGGNVTYSVFIQGAQELTLDVVVADMVGGWRFDLKNGEELLLEEYGMTSVTIGSEGYIDLNLTVYGDGEYDGDLSNIKVSIIRAGETAEYGLLPFIVGTMTTTALAICIAAPLGVGTAIFLSEFCPGRIRRFLRPLFELLAGIPSVIYGLWGFLTFGPLLAGTLYPILGQSGSDGRCILTASIVLGIMILPIIITLSEDSIRAISKEMKEGSHAVGATRWQTIKGVTLKAASSGIIASIILGVGRAIGETMAVLMIMGGSNTMPDSIFDKVGTMTSAIALYFGDVASLEQSRHVVFAIGMILFFMVFLLSITAFYIQKRMDPSKSTKRKTKSRWNLGLSRKLAPIKSKMKLISLKRTKIDVDSTKMRGNLIDRSHLTSSRRLLFSERAVRTAMICGSILVLAILMYILVDIVIRGGSTINLQLFLERESLAGKEGGFLNAIVGSLGMVAIALMVAIPLSIGAAIYVREYAKENNPMTKLVTFASDVLASTPSIVYGVFGFVFLVYYLRIGPSMLAGGVTLGFMIIPLLLRSAIEALKSVPRDHRSASLALGATKWQTVRKIVIPSSLPFIISGTVISMGRAIGETAAVLFTAAYSSFVVDSIMQPTASMPVMIYQYYEVSSKFPGVGEKVYSAALTLIIFVLILNLVARLAGHYASRGMGGK